MPVDDLVRLTLAYRPPLAWSALTGFLRRNAIPGVEMLEAGCYGRTVRLDGKAGVILAEDAAASAGSRHPVKTHLNVQISPSLLPALMPLLARLRQLFDLDAEPRVIDACLEQTGLGAFVGRRPGLRIPGAFDGFEVAFQSLLGSSDLVGRVVLALGERLETVHPTLVRLAPSAERVADAGALRLTALGVPDRRAGTLVSVAREVAGGTLRLEPGGDGQATRRALMAIDGIGDRLATTIVMRALYWPDAFPASDRALQRAAGVSSPRALLVRAERWRPWRAYAALHLWLHAEEM